MFRKEQILFTHQFALFYFSTSFRMGFCRGAGLFGKTGLLASAFDSRFAKRLLSKKKALE